jgi:hypothetical protein
MAEKQHGRGISIAMNDRNLSVVVFSLFFSPDDMLSEI